MTEQRAWQWPDGLFPTELFEALAAYAPRLLGGLLLILAGWLLAQLLRAAVVRVSRGAVRLLPTRWRSPGGGGVPRVLGIVTQTDLTRYQARSSAHLVAAVGEAGSAREMALVTARIPQLLVQLVEANAPHEVATRLLSDVTDAVTRRLIALAEADLGPAPVPWVWMACGSQGRQEQSGVSDQDNCLLVDDALREQVSEAKKREEEKGLPHARRPPQG